MKLSDFDYNLPKNLIAQEPIKPRDHSRLLVLDKETGEIKHKHFYDIVDYFNKGDVIVLNNSKVFPARLIGNKKETGGKVEVFLLKHLRSDRTVSGCGRGNSTWKCLLGGRGSTVGLEIIFNQKNPNLKCKVTKNNDDGTWEVKFNMPQKKMMEIVEKIGLMPLPPYIKRDKKRTTDEKNYQTVYADNKKVGSVAAPTAGFHFTPGLIKKLKKKGVQFEYVTLHVGLGTFLPVKVDNVKKHKMHAEYIEIKKDVAKQIIKAKKEGRKIIAIGTTSVRTLEGCLAKKINKPLSQITNYQLPITTFIYPGYKFKVVDAIITNFHLPKSTLLMLVSAMAGKKYIDKAYEEAIKKKYRFYSYGDAMLIY